MSQKILLPIFVPKLLFSHRKNSFKKESCLEKNNLLKNMFSSKSLLKKNIWRQFFQLNHCFQIDGQAFTSSYGIFLIHQKPTLRASLIKSNTFLLHYKDFNKTTILYRPEIVNKFYAINVQCSIFAWRSEGNIFYYCLRKASQQ